MLAELSPRSRRSRPRRVTRAAALAAFALTAAGLLVAAPAVADGPTTFTNSTPITIGTDTPPPPTPATPYPSTIAVSGMTGPISDVDVRLNGFSHGIADDVDLLLVGPSGANLVLLSDAGGPNTIVIANNAIVTFDDSAPASVPQSGTISGTVSYRPTDTDAGEPGADSFPSPAPAPGSATTLATFTGTNPNGTWRLFVVDDATGDAGSIAGGWSVTITTSQVAASTTTAVSSSLDPSMTGTTVTFTATVTSGGNPVTTGTVTFIEGSTTLVANVPLNASGQATFTTATLAEGSHVIRGTFNGTATLLTSSGTVTQVVDNATTTPDGDTWCNSGGITVPSSGAGTPYPSRITVSGAGSAISLLTLDLADVAHTTPFDLEVLLVGPAGQNLILLSDVGGSTPATGVDLTFADSAGGPIPAAGPLSTGPFDPSDNDGDGADAALPPPAPAASGATTLATFIGTNPNGTWSLFVADDASGDSGSIAGGWCLNVSTAQPSATTLTSSVNPSTVGQPVTFTATVTSGGSPVTAGSIHFTEGATTLAAGVALDASGQATFTTSTLTGGSHTITATYTGTAAFQPSSGSVDQVVQRAPTVTVPADIMEQQTSAAGAVVTYSASATDFSGASLAVICTPPSGSTFPPGITTVTCTATDSLGQTTTETFLVTVADTTPPSITVPGNTTTEIDPGQNDAVVNFIATATDNAGPPNVVCVPPSGTAFPLGTTTVTCTATDAAGNTASGSFTVTVGRPPDLTIAKSHAADFRRGQLGTWTISVKNEGGVPTAGGVRVVDVLPAGIVALGVDAPGWSCTNLHVKVTCTRSDALDPKAAYPSINLAVRPSLFALPALTNFATVNGGGEQRTNNNLAWDVARVTN